MADLPEGTVAIHLPAELFAKLAELKQDRREDRDLSVAQLVERMCRGYVRLREMAREGEARRDEINRSYEEHPNDWDDAEVWKEEFQRRQQDDRP